MTGQGDTNEEGAGQEVGEGFLWQFALGFYRREGVEEACLALQDRFGADVTLLILCCFTGHHGAMLDEVAVNELSGRFAPWAGCVVSPLREVRRYLKTLKPEEGGGEGASALRQEVKRLELQAEKLQIQMLERALSLLPAKDGRAADRRGICRANLLRYLNALSVDTGGEDVRDAIETLAGAAD